MTEGTFQAKDGLKVFYRRWEVANPKAGCLVVHGLGEHSGRYEHLARALNERGFSVWASDHRGHGHSQGIRGDCRSIHQFTEDLHRLVETVEESHPGLPLVMIGHSLGGLIALRYAVEHFNRMKAVVLSSPLLRLAKKPPRFKVGLAKGLAHLLPTAPIPNGVNPEFLCHDPEVVKRYQEDPLVHRVITARCAVVLQRAMAESFSLGSRLKIPCLILQAGEDRICDPLAAEELVQIAKNAPVPFPIPITFRRLEGLYHEIFNEPQQDRVIEDLVHWMEEISHGAKS